MSEASTAKALPVYLQIAELLGRQIKAGYWRAGERLPTEAELAKRLDVAVGTLRKSLALLSDQGVLERVQGSGTYVKKVSGTGQIYELFRLELNQGPGLPTAQILDVTHTRKAGDLPAQLGEDLWRVRRLRYLSQVPVALEEIWFPAVEPERLKPSDLGDSMYLFYQQRYGIWIARVEDQLSAAAVPTWTRAPLTWQPQTCAGFIERYSWTAANQLAEFSRTWFDPKVCRYTSRLSQ